ncbi:MAG TPA: NAD(P)-dependent oxidoreductase [Bradyrhizobium sp.]|uniref:NAD-dependent epimerase/dehydratase family protein n=1 Tax=Bradyrhizobium sp. TaxID=376 RepID=UPI002D7EE63F|nr:NAD(P)-dependent oxidoreductase [Bradyrhizobium sp.]HET7888685.1 NAD(P)-dependent oxidoreductase [Bradyrhizobium sp.]
MNILIFGGTGFVGINIASALLARGHAVALFDRGSLPRAAAKEFEAFGPRLSVIAGDVTDRSAIEQVIARGFDAIVLGAAITAGAAREAVDPQSILQVNLMAQVPILTDAHRHGVRRVINLSSGSAFGAAAFRHALLDEEMPCEPVSLYAITKHASERVVARLAALWGADLVSVRLSGVFGPWEYATGVRDTMSPQSQIVAALRQRKQAVLPRPGMRDWIYAPDVADAVTVLVEAAKPKHGLYHISTGQEWTALEWGRHLADLNPGLVCRLAGPGETPNVNLHSDADRAPLSTLRLAEEFGWRARFGCADSAQDLHDWWLRHGEGM